jgi:hypothetical protein
MDVTVYEGGRQTSSSIRANESRPADQTRCVDATAAVPVDQRAWSNSWLQQRPPELLGGTRAGFLMRPSEPLRTPAGAGSASSSGRRRSTPQ